jgi:hypothetical protein
MVSEDVLRRRFSEFSTAGAFVLVKIQNSETGEQSVIVCENTDWFLTAKRQSYPIASQDEYINYMMHYQDTFLPVPPNSYQHMAGNFDAGVHDAYTEDAALGMALIVEKYLEKFYWSPGGAHAYRIRDRNLSRSADFLRMLLEMGLVLRRECESGMVYIEAGEVDAQIPSGA